jgi:hypothetical protein
MRKEDYKSIQNMSMDTAEFRQIALDTGVAMGTLKKNADGTYQSIVKGAKSSKFNISQFADHLTQDAWFTSDVMMAVYNKYGAAVNQIYEYAEKKGVTASQAIKELGPELDKFGVKAFKAAQEARSWGDTVEAVESTLKTINGNSLIGTGDITVGGSLPTQTGQSGKFLTTNGTDASWASLPTVDQTYSSSSTNAQSGIAITGAGFLQNTATGSNAVTILGTASTSGSAINIGYGSVASAGGAVSMGRIASASGSYATALGYSATASANYAIQLGYGTNSTASTLAVGFNNTNYQLLDSSGIIPYQRIDSVTNGNSNTQLKFYSCTQSQYDEITTKDANTLYIILES